MFSTDNLFRRLYQDATESQKTHESMEKKYAQKKVNKSFEKLDDVDLQKAGLSLSESRLVLDGLAQVVASIGVYDLPAAWDKISKTVLKPAYPDAVHQLLFNSTYHHWDEANLGPPPAWLPSLDLVQCTNLGCFLDTHGTQLLGSLYKDPIASFSDFQKWSAEHPEVYVEMGLKELSIVFHEQPKSILDATDEKMPGAIWLAGGVLNAAESALASNIKMNKYDSSLAIVWRDEGADDLPVNTLSLGDLRAHVNQVANSLVALGFQEDDAIGIDMPMNVQAVIVYLAIVLAGMVVVSIADSFVAREIAIRCKVSQAKGIFTQDHILRGSKRLPLYSRVIEANAPKSIVIPADGANVALALRDGDLTWDSFLSYSKNYNRPEEFHAVPRPTEAMSNILFSSGTSGEPKAIPWTQISPLKCALDAWGHQDIRHGDVVAWPTNLGWMMGPYLIYAALLNGASLALYNGSPLGHTYGKFMQDAGVTVQGTIPSLVKTWRNTGCMDKYDWSKIRIYSTTGEASSLEDDLWLASRSLYNAPVLECCGGTELAGSYVGGCLLQPQAFAAFSTPSLSNEFVLLDDYGNAYPEDQPCTGEVGLAAISFGSSSRLLNADHEKVYYAGMPLYKGKRLRRHGDVFERTPGGFYRAHGRADDTMNLGGIKASAVEIERVCNIAHERVIETAAIAIPPLGGGPDQLIILAVLKDGRSVGLDTLKKAFSLALQSNLNPLFKVSAVEVVPEFPRTASNKVLRRVLRAQLLRNAMPPSKL